MNTPSLDEQIVPTSFQSLPLNSQLQEKLAALGFTVPTEIQAKAIPLLIAHDRIDIHGQAQTGTGKTLAFGLPLLQKINTSSRTTQAIIIAPTRELALQICDSLRPFAQALRVSIDAIYGGASIEAQIRSLRQGLHIVVGTPGRLRDHLERKTLNLQGIKTLVLDEADIMLDMGFKEEIEEILKFMPKDREIWLFSATVKGGINEIMTNYMKNPISVRVSRKQVLTANTKHYYCVVPGRNRLNALCRFIESAPQFYGFIFCQTKLLTAEIAEQLLVRGFKVGSLHGDMSQPQRNTTVRRFKGKEINILVATDVAARGIDIANLTHVINYSLSEDQEAYVHRTGRTGRAGREGIAITFVSKSEVRYLQTLQRKFGVVINPINVPSRQDMILSRIKEIEAYLASSIERMTPEEHELNVLIDKLTPEQVKNTLKQILFDKFLQVVYEEEEISNTPSFENVSQETGDSTEIFLTVGSDDGVRPEDIAQLLEVLKINKDAILRVRLIKRRTFIHVANDAVKDILNKLQNKRIRGRAIRAFVATPNEGGQGGHREHRDGENRGSRSGGQRRSFGRDRRR